MKKSSILSVLILLLSFQTFPFPTSFSPIVKSERKKVVHIAVTTTKEERQKRIDPFFDQLIPNIPQQRKQQASGSGFIISEDGFIVTNNHVIDGADKVEVILFDDRRFPAKVWGTDPKTDLALLKIEISNLPYATFGDSDKMEVGDWVLAIGNPLGLNHTVTAGIISATSRDIIQGTAYGQFIQTDTAINFGNSGGPLLNTDSEVIGINTAIIANGQSLGFAVPSNLAKNVIEQLKTDGSVTRGWLGIGIQSLTPELAEAWGLKEKIGVVVTQVNQGSPAEKAGLQEADIITKYDDNPLKKYNDLQLYVAETKPGNKAILTVLRNGEAIQLSIIVGTRENSENRSGQYKKLGLVLDPLNVAKSQELNLSISNGLIVQNILPNSIAFINGMRKGDIIIQVNRKSVGTIKDFDTVLEKSKNNKVIALLVHRQGSQIFFVLPLK